MTEPSTPDSSLPNELRQTLINLVERGQKIMAHGWMVRTFVKHSDEVDDFPELNEMARTIFDVFRAVETQVNDPVAYFRTIRKKLARLRAAADQFEKDAWHASTHTNFQQAVVASKFVGEQLQELLTEAERLLPRPAPPKISMPTSSAVLPSSGRLPERADEASPSAE